MTLEEKIAMANQVRSRDRFGSVSPEEQAALPAQTEQIAARAALQGHRHSQCHSLNVVVFLRDVDILHPGKAFHSAADKLLRVAARGLPAYTRDYIAANKLL